MFVSEQYLQTVTSAGKKFLGSPEAKRAALERAKKIQMGVKKAKILQTLNRPKNLLSKI